MSEHFEVSRPECDDRKFYARSECFFVNDIFVKGSNCSAQTFCRSLEIISQMPHEVINITLIRKGSVSAHSKRKRISLKAGDIVFIDKGEYSVAESSDFKEIGIDIPKQLLLHRLVINKDFHLMKISPDDDFYNLLKTHILHIYNEDTQTINNSIIQQSTIELIRLILESKSSNHIVNELNTGADIERVYQYICQNYHDRKISPDTISKAINVSRSSLYRTIKEHGGILGIINEIRVKKALHFMKNNLNVSDLNEQLLHQIGFGSERSMRRAFSDTIGLTPKQVHEHLKDNPGRKNYVLKIKDRYSEIYEKLYKEWLQRGSY